MTKLFITFCAVLGVAYFVGRFDGAHKQVFMLMGYSFTWITLAAIGTIVLTWRAIK